MPDGVQITLLWFEPKDAAPEAPLVVSLHGIGGDENSVRPIVLAEECLRRGWRSVLYVRRGHGDSSLLPVRASGTTVAAVDGAFDDGGGDAPGVVEVTAAVAVGGAGKAAAAATGEGADGGGNGVKQIAAVVATARPTAAAAAVADAPAAASLDLPTPASSPSATATTVTIVATDAGNDSAAGTAATSPGPPHVGCLPKKLHLPLLGASGGGGDGGDATAAAAVDPEALRRTRKAFPQHADTEDFMVVLQHIRAVRPEALMVAVGFSMGSNVLVKFLGEHPPAAETAAAGEAAAAAAQAAQTRGDTDVSTTAGPGGTLASPAGVGGGEGQPRGSGQRQGGWAEEDPKNPLAAAVSVSNGYDIIEGTRHLVSSRHLADRIITGALHKLLRRKLPEVHAICAAHNLLVDFDEVLSCNTVRDFERALMVPICGLDDVDAYYTHNNCREALMNVGTPLLCLSALDDPIIDPSLLRHAEAAAAKNPNVLLVVTRRGGHLGWISGWAGRSWMIDVIVQFVEGVARRHADTTGRGGGGGGGGAAAAKGQTATAALVPAGSGGPTARPGAGTVESAAGAGSEARSASIRAAATVAADAGAARLGAGSSAVSDGGTAVAVRRNIDVTASSSSSSATVAAATAVAAGGAGRGVAAAGAAEAAAGDVVLKVLGSGSSGGGRQ